MVVRLRSRTPAPRLRLPLAALAAIVAATTLSGHAPHTAASAAPADDATDPLMVRTLVPTGSAATSVMSAHLLPSERTSRRNPKKEWLALPADAFFVNGDAVELRLDPADVPAAYINPGGIVSLNIHYADTAKRRVDSDFLSVRAAHLSGTPVWVAPEEEVPSLRANPSARRPALTPSALSSALRTSSATASVASLTAAAPKLVVDPVAAPRDLTLPTIGYRVAGTQGAQLREPIGGVPQCRPTGKTSRRWATVGTSYPLSKSKSTLTYSASSSSSLGGAVSWDSGVSFKAAGSTTTSDAWEQKFHARNVNRSYRTQTHYEQIRCHNTGSGEEITRSWRAAYQTGGTREYMLSGAPDHFRTCVPVAAGEWTRSGAQGKDYSFDAGVKFKGVIGIDLSTSRAYTNGASLIYDSPKKRRICGNGDVPSRAAKMRERPRVRRR